MNTGATGTSGPDNRTVVGPRVNGELLSVVNSAGLVLDGLIFRPPSPRLAIIHVHGSLGNFYHQSFIRVFASRFARHGIAFLSFNLTAHDGIAEGYSAAGDMRYVGGSLAPFESCLDDLDALVRVARTLCPRVVLQGHSLGCDRVLFYAQQRTVDIPLILLSPCDSHRLQEQWLDSETVTQQVARLAATSDAASPLQLVNPSEYGVAGPDGWTYSIPVTKAALLSIIAGPPFQLLRVGSTAQPLSGAPAFVYLGAEDSIRGAGLQELIAHLRALMPSARVFTSPRGDHCLQGCEETVADAISAWAGEAGLLDCDASLAADAEGRPEVS